MTALALKRLGLVMLTSATLALPIHGRSAPTARVPIKDSTTAAHKWQADSVLTQVSTLMARSDGTAATWLLTFYSPKARRSAIVTARESGQVEIEPDVRNASTEPLPGEFIDSDRAVALAVKAGLQLKPGASVMLGLTGASAKVSKVTAYWAVTVPSTGGFASVTLDAKDGQVITSNGIK